MSLIFDALSALGAATGAPALGWQVYTWRASGPKVQVEVSNAYPKSGGSVLGRHYFEVRAVNVGRAPATVSAWGLQAPDGRDLVVDRLQQPPSEPLPADLPAQASVSFYVEALGVRELCRGRGLRAGQLRGWVRMATGKQVLGGYLPWDGD